MKNRRYSIENVVLLPNSPQPAASMYISNQMTSQYPFMSPFPPPQPIRQQPTLFFPTSPPSSLHNLGFSEYIQGQADYASSSSLAFSPTSSSTSPNSSSSSPPDIYSRQIRKQQQQQPKLVLRPVIEACSQSPRSSLVASRDPIK